LVNVRISSLLSVPEIANTPPPSGNGYGAVTGIGVNSYINELLPGVPVKVNICSTVKDAFPEPDASTVGMNKLVRTACTMTAERIILPIRRQYTGVFLFGIPVILMLNLSCYTSVN